MFTIIDNYVQNNDLPENDYIENLVLMPHSKLSFDCNLGAWWQRNLNLQKLNSVIIKKESKINNYRINSGIKEQWLLVVIGSLGESSYAIESIEALKFTFETGFDKIFLLEDFQANLYEIK